MQLRDIPKDIPETPGVYTFLDGQEILYIGKATNLKDRIKSYMSSDLEAMRGPKIVRMRERANKVMWQETRSVLEALIAESHAIKKHQPPYNTREKDNKSYAYVVITDELYPRVFTMRERDLLKKQRLDIPLLYTFGPYPHSKTLREALRIVRKIFPFRDKRAVSKDHERFYASLGLSPETHTTTADTARAAYLETIEHIRLLFEGNTSGLVQKLTQDMHAHAEKRAFEEAEKIKRQLFALEHIQDIALMHEDDYTLSPKHASKKSVRIEAYDVAHLQGSNPVGVMVVIVDGSIENSQHRVFDIRNGHKGSDVHALEEILVRRLRHTEWAYPTYIVVDGGTAQKRTAERVLKEYNLSIPVISVVKDQRHKPREIRGQAKVIEQYQKWILLANHESHRFALKQHTNKRKKSLA